MKRVFLCVLVVLFLVGMCWNSGVFADIRTPTWDGWDFIIRDVQAEGMMISVIFCNVSKHGQLGRVTVTCSVDGSDLPQAVGVPCPANDCKRVNFRVPDSIFGVAPFGSPHDIAKKMTREKPPVPEGRKILVPISIKGGPLGWHQFYYTERWLYFQR